MSESKISGIPDSIEGALEYYDGTRGFLALGMFYKNMKSFVTTETTQVPYGETGYPLSLLEEGLDASTVFNFTRPINGPGASIHGVELAARVRVRPNQGEPLAAIPY